MSIKVNESVERINKDELFVNGSEPTTNYAHRTAEQINYTTALIFVFKSSFGQNKLYP